METLENFSFLFRRKGGGGGGLEEVEVVLSEASGRNNFEEGESRRNATEPDRGKWSRGGGGGHYCVRVPCTTTLRAVHACNRFSFRPLSPLSPLSLVRPVKINKGTINKNYTFFIHLAREGLGWVGFGWLRPTIAAIPSWSSPPPPRLEPSPLRFQPSISPFFWKEKEKEEEVRKKFSSIDRWTVFEEEDSRDGEYNWSIFFFFPQDGLFSFGFQRNCPNRTARNYRSTFRTEGDINLLLRISKIPDILLFPPYLYQDVP